MRGICAAGELLVDLTPYAPSPQDRLLYACNPGGAPANVLAMARKFGAEARLCAVVGMDAMGSFLIDSVRAAGIDTAFIRRTGQAPTTLALVSLDESNDRSFSFYRSPGADIFLTEDCIPQEAMQGCGIYHFSGIALTQEPAAGAVLAGAGRARRSGLLISFDPNHRPFLWPDEKEAKKAFSRAMACSDIIKLSEEEAELLTDGLGPEEAALLLAKGYDALVLVSRGAKGALAAVPSGLLAEARALDVNVEDTTGAGDAFLGTLLAQLSGKSKGDLLAMDRRDGEKLLAMACGAGSLAASKLGAIPAMPEAEKVLAAMARPDEEVGSSN